MKTKLFVTCLLGSVFLGAMNAEAQKEASLLSERLPAKIQAIQEELPAWIEKTGNLEQAKAFMQKLKTHLDAKNFVEAEKTADSILEMIGARAPVAAQDIPGEALKKLRHDVGGSFIVSRDKVQEELMLTRQQKEKLEQLVREVLPHAISLFQKIEGLDPAERRKELGAFRLKAQEKLAAVLNETLSDGQRKRLRQLELQREGLRSGETWNDLQLTDEQRKQFLAMMQRAQKETQLLLEELQRGGKSKAEIQPQVIKVRDKLEGKLEALLTNAQRTRWKEMRGEPMDLANLFDL
jgi:Spy/CpxP family protein refolding chaperone